MYLFDQLSPGEYRVKFTAPNGYGFTLKDTGGDDAVDSDATRADGYTNSIVCDSEKTNLTII